MMRRLMIVTALLSALSACQSTGQTTQKVEATQPKPRVPSMSHADKVSAPAKGTKSCHVRQAMSDHLSNYDRLTFLRSDIFVKVYKNGTAAIAVSEYTYPGTNAYFLVGGVRVSADGDEYATLSASALSALKRDEVVKYNYTEWPYRNEVNQEDKLAGFEAAYNDCLAFLRS